MKKADGGERLLRYFLCLLFSLFCNVLDWKTYKVPNSAVLIFSVLGLFLNTAAMGLSGLLAAFGGGAVMFVLFPLFVLRMLGAGDVKTLMAVGFMVRFPDAVSVMLASILGAGAAAAMVMLGRKNGKLRVKRFITYCKFCFYTRQPQPYTQAGDTDGGKFRFTFGITVGLTALMLRELLFPYMT